MKNMRNNFGVKGVTKPGLSFFNDLKKPADTTWAKRAHKVFKDVANVKVVCVEA